MGRGTFRFVLEIFGGVAAVLTIGVVLGGFFFPSAVEIALLRIIEILDDTRPPITSDVERITVTGFYCIVYSDQCEVTIGKDATEGTGSVEVVMCDERGIEVGRETFAVRQQSQSFVAFAPVAGQSVTVLLASRLSSGEFERTEVWTERASRYGAWGSSSIEVTSLPAECPVAEPAPSAASK